MVQYQVLWNYGPVAGTTWLSSRPLLSEQATGGASLPQHGSQELWFTTSQPPFLLAIPLKNWPMHSTRLSSSVFIEKTVLCPSRIRKYASSLIDALSLREEDDTEGAHAANRNGSRKDRRVSSSEIIFAPESSSAYKRPVVNPQSREALQRLLPPATRPRQRSLLRNEANPPELKPCGMQNQSPWGTGSSLRGTKLDLTLAQFQKKNSQADAFILQYLRQVCQLKITHHEKYTRIT